MNPIKRIPKQRADALKALSKQIRHDDTVRKLQGVTDEKKRLRIRMEAALPDGQRFREACVMAQDRVGRKLKSRQKPVTEAEHPAIIKRIRKEVSFAQREILERDFGHLLPKGKR